MDNAEGTLSRGDSCSCISGLGKSCCHAAAILWKIFLNPNIYFSVKAASHASLHSSFLRMACRALGTDMFVKVVDVLHKKFLNTYIFMNCCGNQQWQMLYLSSF